MKVRPRGFRAEYIKGTVLGKKKKSVLKTGVVSHQAYLSCGIPPYFFHEEQIIVIYLSTQVWIKTIPNKRFGFRAFSNFALLRLWSALALALRESESYSFLLLFFFTGNPRLTCFQTCDCTIIHLLAFNSVCVLRCLSSDKETGPVCATSKVSPLGGLGALQIASHHHQSS